LEGVSRMGLRRAVLFLAMGALLTGFVLPCGAAEKDTDEKKEDDSVWTGEIREGSRRHFELTDEEIARVMKRIKESNPQKAKELTELRKKGEDGEREFRSQLREHGRAEFDKVIRERIEAWRAQRVAEFLEWLRKNYSREASDLAKIKTKDANLYNKKFDILWDKYRGIYEAWRRNPELGKVLKDDLAHKKRRDDLIGKIKREKDQKKRNELGVQLHKVVAQRFDLIVRRKQIAFEQLLKRLKDLQEQINESKIDIREWRGEKFKDESVKKRIKDLTEGMPKFKWD